MTTFNTKQFNKFSQSIETVVINVVTEYVVNGVKMVKFTDSYTSIVHTKPMSFFKNKIVK